MGARPLARVIQDTIKKPLANEILFGKLKKGGVVNVTVGPKEDGKPGIVLEAIPDTAPIKPKPEAEVVHPDADDQGDGELKTKAAPKTRAKTVPQAEPEVRDAPKKGSTVPKVPRKKRAFLVELKKAASSRPFSVSALSVASVSLRDQCQASAARIFSA